MSTKSIKVIKFSGKKTQWREFERRFLARAIEKDFFSALEPSPRRTQTNTEGDEVVVPFTEEENKANQIAFASLTLSTTKRAGGIVDKSRTTERPGGDASVAWRNLKQKYKETTITDKEELKTEFNNRMLHTGEDPSDWMYELEVLRMKINDIKANEVSEQDIITHVLHNLPIEYENFVMKQHDIMAALPSGEEMNYDKFEADISEHHRRLVRLRRVNNREENFAYSLNKSPKLKSPFPRRFKGRCRHCGVIGHKEAQCWKKKSGQKGKRDYSSDENGPRIKGKCHWCLKQGHMEKYCKSKKAGKPRAESSDSCNALTHSEETDVDNVNEVAFSTIDMTSAWKAIQDDMIKEIEINVPSIEKSEKSHNYYDPLMDTDEEDDVWDLINMKELSPVTSEEWDEELDEQLDSAMNTDVFKPKEVTQREGEAKEFAVHIKPEALASMKRALSDDMRGVISVTNDWKDFSELNKKNPCKECENGHHEGECIPSMKTGQQKFQIGL